MSIRFTTGYGVDRGQSALSKRSPFFKSPRADSDLINAILQSVAAASITWISDADYRASEAGCKLLSEVRELKQELCTVKSLQL